MNAIIDLNKSNGESYRKPFKPWKKKTNYHNPQEVEGMNFEEETMDKWCQAHNDNHLEETCRKFINMYNIFLEPILKSKKGNNDKEKVLEEI